MKTSLRAYVWGSVTCVLAIAGAITCISIAQDRQTELAHGCEIAGAVATSLQEHASAAIRDITNGLNGAKAEIRSNGGLQHLSEARLRDVLAREFVDNVNIVDILLLNREGRVQAHTNEQTALPAAYPESRILKQLADKTDQQPLVSPPLLGPAYKRWLLPISVRVDG